MKRVQMMIPEEMYQMLKNEAKRLEINVSEMIRVLAREYLEKQGKTL